MIIAVVPASNSARLATFTGDGFSGLFIWGAQLEAGAFASPYIKTEAAQVTRLADSAVMTGVNFSSWFNPNEGTLFVDCVFSATSNTLGNFMTAVAVSDGTVSNRIRMLSGANSAFEGGVSGVVQFGIGSAPINSSAKVAGAYKVNDFSVSINGAAVLTDTSGTVPVVSQMQIGNLITGRDMSGYIKRITYYPQALTSANLQAVTR
jgi:hypothetical protein